MNRDFARQLRKEMTDAERLIWSYLRRKKIGNHRFRRQAPLGKYIVDFVCFEQKVIVELDGGQHSAEENRRKDTERTEWLEGQGFRVLRFWNHEVFESTDAVLETILNACDGLT